MSAVADPLREQLQSALGRTYTIQRELGGGGMSRVFLATDTRLEREVVVKVLSPELMAGLSAERFAREIKLAAQLQEPHIVPVLADGVTPDGVPYYTMPFVRGATLRERLKEGRVPVADAMSILRDIARALAFAHGRGVIHRDIKPENVLLHEGTAVVADFGIAKAVQLSRTRDTASELTSAGMSLGTPGYMAPEQAVGDITDHRSDVYAWGVLAYELLNGAHPFASKTGAQQMIAAHISELPAPLARTARDVPTGVAQLVMSALEKDPAKRPQSADAILSALSAPVVTRRGVPRWVTAAGIAVLALAATGLWMRSRGIPVADKSVAVLPFSTLGGDSSQSYFAEGMADELTTSLTRIPGLRVAAVNAAAAARASALTPQDAGRVLHVAALLIGAVQRSGDQIRVRAQLVNAVDGSALWSDHFDEKASDVFAAQDHLAQRISGALHEKLATDNVVVASDHGTKDLVAYDLYLQARHLFARRGAEHLKDAIRLYGLAASRDSSFARAYSGAAMAYVVLPDYDSDSMAVRIARGIELARRALRADSADVDALAALGYAYVWRGEWAEAERFLKRALVLAPQNLTAHHWYGDLLLYSGRVQESVGELRIARDIDPLSAIVQSEYANSLVVNRQYDRAIAEGQKGVALDPTLVLAYTNYAEAFLLENKLDSALTQYRKALALDSAASTARGYMVAALMAKGLTDSAHHETDRLLRRVRPPSWSVDPIIALTAIGDKKRALDYLEAAVKSGSAGAVSTAYTDPYLDSLRLDPRYKAIVSKIAALHTP